MQLNNSAVCTLFEGHYHYGVAALVNSLSKNEFKGNFYAGYKGDLPKWSQGAKENKELNWAGAKSLEIVKEFYIHFLPVVVSRHFANHKPDFMLQLLDGPAKDVSALFYFDPDIVIKCEWNFFEYWASNGIAVVHEIMYNDMPATHPIRKLWAGIIEKIDKKVIRELNLYINSGFCGVSLEHKAFLRDWANFIDIGINEYNANPNVISNFSKTHPFCFIDQDSLNIALMCYPAAISEVGPDGMDFSSGGFLMSHALGNPKAWKKKFISSALKGIGTTTAEKTFWNYVDGPIKIFSNSYIKRKKLSISIASFIGRFYNRR